MDKINLVNMPDQAGLNVKHWLEDTDKNIIVTLVDGYFPNEMNLRISDNFDRFEVRGHKSIMNDLTIDQIKSMALTHIERNRSLKNNEY